MPHTRSKFGASQASQIAYAWAARVKEKKVAIGTVSGALSAVGKTVDLAYEGNPTKYQGEKTLVPRLAQIL